MAFRFGTLPSKTKWLLGIGVVLALTLALPLFIWGIMTQRFDIRKRAQVTFTQPPAGTSFGIPTPQPPVEDCRGIPNDTACLQEVCPPGGNGPCSFQNGICHNDSCVIPAQSCKGVLDGTVCETVICPGPPGSGVACYKTTGSCRSNECVLPTPVESCTGVADGTSCQGSWCPPPGMGVPCRIFDGTCQNQVCVEPTGSPRPTTCPDGNFGNVNCDSAQLINETDLSILLSMWRIWHPGEACYSITYPAGTNRIYPNLGGDCGVNETDLSILLGHWKTQ